MKQPSVSLTIYGHIKTAEQRTIIQQYGVWYIGRWSVGTVGYYIWYSKEEPGRAAALPISLLAVPNVSAHPPTTNHSIWHYNCVYTVMRLQWLSSGSIRKQFFCGDGGWPPSFVFVNTVWTLHPFIIIISGVSNRLSPQNHPRAVWPCSDIAGLSVHCVVLSEYGDLFHKIK